MRNSGTPSDARSCSVVRADVICTPRTEAATSGTATPRSAASRADTPRAGLSTRVDAPNARTELLQSATAVAARLVVKIHKELGLGAT